MSLSICKLYFILADWGNLQEIAYLPVYVQLTRLLKKVIKRDA